MSFLYLRKSGRFYAGKEGVMNGSVYKELLETYFFFAGILFCS